GSTHWDPPYSHFAGCDTHCLGCWLGCGPEVPIWESEATDGNPFSAVVDSVTSQVDLGKVVVLLRAPYYAAEKAWSAAGYRLIDENGVVPNGWSCRADAEL